MDTESYICVNCVCELYVIFRWLIFLEEKNPTILLCMFCLANVFAGAQMHILF